MGAWGSGPFDNDDAMDFLGDLSDEGGPGREARIRAALDLPEDYIEAPEASEALAAAALIVAATTAPPDQPEEVHQLVAEGGIPMTDGDREAAKRALSRILDPDSEWRDLWAEAGSLEEMAAMCSALSRSL